MRVILLLFETGKLKIRYLQERDKQLLVKWLSDPAVLEYYEGRDNPFDLAKVEKAFYGKDNGVFKCLVLYGEAAIGYIQFYPVNKQTSTINDFDEQENTYGIDQFIGEPDYWNKGIGTLLVRGIVEFLTDKKQAHNVILDPQLSNKRAIRCYEKCGFYKVRVLPGHEWHEGEYRDCLLMALKAKQKGVKTFENR